MKSEQNWVKKFRAKSLLFKSCVASVVIVIVALITAWSQINGALAQKKPETSGNGTVKMTNPTFNGPTQIGNINNH